MSNCSVVLLRRLYVIARNVGGVLEWVSFAVVGLWGASIMASAASKEIVGALWGGCKFVFTGVYNRVYSPVKPRQRKRKANVAQSPRSSPPATPPRKRQRRSPSADHVAQVFTGTPQARKYSDPPTVNQKKKTEGGKEFDRESAGEEERCEEREKAPVFDGTPYYTRKVSHLERIFELNEGGNKSGGGERIGNVGLETICEDGANDGETFNMGFRSEGCEKRGPGGSGVGRSGFGVARKPVRRSKRLSGMHTPSKKEGQEVKRERIRLNQSLSRKHAPWVP